MTQYQTSPAPCTRKGCNAKAGEPCVYRYDIGKPELVGKPRVTLHHGRPRQLVVPKAVYVGTPSGWAKLGDVAHDSATDGVEPHVRHDLIRETNRVSCDGCSLDVKRPEGVPNLGRAWSSWR